MRPADAGHSDDHGGAILPDILRWIWRDYPSILPAKGRNYKAIIGLPTKKR
jgi:hypothetical protein